LLSHGWLEEMTMHVLRSRVVVALREADRTAARAAPRFEVYYPHIEGLAAGTCIDMHSKVMIVDDEWLRVGSANLSNRSMGVDTECDMVIEAHGLARVADRIRAFRDGLLAEHTGSTPAAVARAIAQHGTMAAAIAHLGRASGACKFCNPSRGPTA
jgi:phosphatidylserine/phosphatidylglycerophosphate/cardiolipin synthase-like enzyme